MKFYNSHVKHSRVPPITLQEYEAHLGEDSKRLEKHIVGIIQLVSALIASGCSLTAHVDWAAFAERVGLTMDRRVVMVKKAPGFRFWLQEDYHKEHGYLNTNGKLQEGHRWWTLHGK